MAHKHKWVASARGISENPGCWDTGNGALLCRELCRCGAQREQRRSYCGRGGDYSRILRPGEPGYSVEDARQARALAE